MRFLLLLLSISSTALAVESVYILPPPVAPSTLAEKKSVTRVKITAVNNSTLNTIKANFLQLHKEIWNNPLGLTPQEVMDAYGTDASLMVLVYGRMKTAIGSFAPSYSIPADPHTLTTNGNGTVTVGE